ncbi:MAG: NADH-quinone oxidoreductase subunit L [Gemmataceae bacterium]|nr:NADH-quinone oxidoreductase subunit L [Gemmataceae bacterium]MDW8243085.1 NADH-quinone oxidoreductase subunit L [Thermogemmata sp.]
MSEPIGLVWLILLLPLAGAVTAALLTPARFGRTLAHVPMIVACACAALLAVTLLTQWERIPQGQLLSEPWTWFAAGRLHVRVSLAVDALALTMLTMITVVSSCIGLFSVGYMAGERGYARYFAVMSLFVFAMCGLVLANNFFLLLGFWELVGLCSYLLIGYYFVRPSAAAAARKAFLVTRLGDVGFVLGIFWLWKLSGWQTDLTAVFDHLLTHQPPQEEITAACLLLLCGAVGKSAQFPLYVWLPDAMEGPTPVSALIHAATMVTAGVYLVGRCAPLFALSPTAVITTAWLGGLTALLAAFLALAQTDLKRILAYSTVSQLGYMFLALGTLGAVHPTLAVIAALFHLLTHALFKALLFLSAGSVMHALGGIIDLRQFGGLRHRLPLTHLCFLCGAAALAGVPLLSGFWSKDLILESVIAASEQSPAYGGGYYLLLLMSLLTALLTAFYTFRAYFLAFWGPERLPPQLQGHVHEASAVMSLPLVVLAIGAVGAGAILEPFTHALSQFVATTPALQQAATVVTAPAWQPHIDWTVASISTVLAATGIALAAGLFARGEPEQLPAVLAPVMTLSQRELYIEAVYRAVLIRPAEGLAFLAKVADQAWDGLLHLLAALPGMIGQWLRVMHNGLVQFYALAMMLGLVVLMIFVVLGLSR